MSSEVAFARNTKLLATMYLIWCNSPNTEELKGRDTKKTLIEEQDGSEKLISECPLTGS